MKDIRKIVLDPLAAAIATATGRLVYDTIPDPAVYPYIYISEAYLTEVGTKIKFQYELDVLVQVVHMGDISMGSLYNDMDDVLGIINNGPCSLTLASPYKVLQGTLNSSSTTEILTEIGKLQIGLIRINFLITKS
jgi:hypothetical protein